VENAVDWEMPIKGFCAGDKSGISHRCALKVYGYCTDTWGIKRQDIAKQLQDAGMNAESKISLCRAAHLTFVACAEHCANTSTSHQLLWIVCMLVWEKSLPG
jgi:hypothetical protein